MDTKLEHIPKRYTWIIGIDEAGRGPLAGPCAVGLVMVARRDMDALALTLSGVRDSKRLSPSKRVALIERSRAEEAQGTVMARVVFCGAELIDRVGISQCLRNSISEGVSELLRFREINPKSVFIYLDGALRAPAEYRQQTMVGGDNKVFAIALASIYAKVARDAVMEEYDTIYPQYRLCNHKGYGTTEHVQAIKTHGTCPIHRQTYLKNIVKHTSP